MSSSSPTQPGPAQSSARQKQHGWLLLLLLAAMFLRLVAISSVPPGMTHDEADHGLDAWGVVNGIRPLYFTVGYGREPFFDYSTAALMSFLGPTYLAGRLDAVFFSLILVAGTYTWTARAFDRRTALLNAAGLAVSFWGVMTGRQALRSVTMPAFFALVVALFWSDVRAARPRPGRLLVAGLLLGFTFYTYMPARILWVLFPGLLLYWGLFNRPRLRQHWPRVLLMLLLAGAVAYPLFAYLRAHPGSEVRLSQLTGPLQAARQGNWQPLLVNLAGSLRLFTFSGDSLWRYNIPGKPFLGPLMGLLFYAGILLALAQVLRRPRQAAPHAFALAWLLGGMVPAFITGPEASVTRVIGMQPVLTLFPALSLNAAYRALRARGLPPRWQRYAPLVPLLLFAGTFAATARDYFIVWANNPEVRVQYESTLVAAMQYLNEQGQGAVALSNPSPDQFHSPSTALMTLRNEAVSLRWFNGLHSLLLPQAEGATLIFPGFAPLNPVLQTYFQPEAGLVAPPEVLPLRPTDIDRPLTIYRVNGPALGERWQEQFSPLGVDFAGSLTLLGSDLLTPSLPPGGLVQLATLWQAELPAAELVLFTHLPDPGGGPPLAQDDRLDAPSRYWQAGDLFIQLHTFHLPADLPPGSYPLIVGVYHRQGGQRLPLAGSPTGGDTVTVATLIVAADSHGGGG